MSMPKFLSTSELSSTLLTDLLSTNQACYKLAVDESLVDVGKSSSQMSLEVGKSSPVDENYLFPFHF